VISKVIFKVCDKIFNKRFLDKKTELQ